MRHALAALTLGAALAGLGGCALLSNPDPVQMYRFGLDAAAVPATTAVRAQVALSRIEFPEAIGSDRILGVTGSEAAYIAGARWVSPAEDLFTQSLENAFARSGRVRIISRREVAPTASSLHVDIRTFEARYAHEDAAPVVQIAARARLMDLSDRAVIAEQVFAVSQPTSANRVGSIVQAFDAATRDINQQIVAWTETNAPGS